MAYEKSFSQWGFLKNYLPAILNLTYFVSILNIYCDVSLYLLKSR